LIGRRNLPLVGGAGFWLGLHILGCRCKRVPAPKPFVNARKMRVDEQAGWQLIPTTIAHPIPRRIHQSALENAGGQMGKSGGN